MNDEKPNMPRSSRADETAEDIFARIQRRRALAMNGNNTERGALYHTDAVQAVFYSRFLCTRQKNKTR